MLPASSDLQVAVRGGLDADRATIFFSMKDTS
jgi:hypothetical protein